MAETNFGKMNVAKDLSWILGNVDFLVKVFGIRDMCRCPDGGQILTTIDAPLFRLSEPAEGKLEERS